MPTGKSSGKARARALRLNNVGVASEEPNPPTAQSTLSGVLLPAGVDNVHGMPHGPLRVVKSSSLLLVLDGDVPELHWLVRVRLVRGRHVSELRWLSFVRHLQRGKHHLLFLVGAACLRLPLS